MTSSSESNFGTPVIQRPIIFVNELNLIDSEAKRELQNWKPRQRQTPIIDVQNSSVFQSRHIHLRNEFSRDERENFTSIIPESPNITPIERMNLPEKQRPIIYDSPKRIPESPVNTQPTIPFNVTPARKSVSPPIHKLFNNQHVNRDSPVNIYNSPKIRRSPTNVRQSLPDFTSLESSSTSDSNSADKTLTPQDFEGPDFVESEIDKFEKVFKQLNSGIADLRNSLTKNPTKNLSESRLYDPKRYSSSQSLSTSSDSRIVNQPRKQIPQSQQRSIGQAQAYSINTELHATFDFPRSSSKTQIEVCKTLARSFIDRTKEVYKLKVAIRNREVNDASSVGDKEKVKRLRAEEVELVNEFNSWKSSTKNHYKHLINLQRDTQALQQVILELQQKIKHAQQEATRLCNVIEAHERTPPMYAIQSVDKVVQTTGRLTQQQEPFRNPLNAPNQKAENFLVQRSVQTSSFVSQHFVGREIQQIYNINPKDVTNIQPFVETKSSKPDPNSSVVSLFEDESLLDFPARPIIGNNEPSPSRVPPLNFTPLNTSAQLLQSVLPVSDRANEERSASTANTEYDVSSIAFDEVVRPPAKMPSTLAGNNYPLKQSESMEKEQGSLNTSSRTIDEKLANVEEIEVQNEALESDLRISPQHNIEDSIVELEETREDFKLFESNTLEPVILPDDVLQPFESTANDEEIMSSKKSHSIDSAEGKNLSDSEVKPTQTNEDKDSSVEEIHVEQMTSDSVASELPSSAFDDSLANLDEPIAQDNSHKNNSSSSIASNTVSSPKQNVQKSNSSSSLKSPLSASDKSILRVKSFQISSEVHSSNGSKQPDISTDSSLSTI